MEQDKYKKSGMEGKENAINDGIAEPLLTNEEELKFGFLVRLGLVRRKKIHQLSVDDEWQRFIKAKTIQHHKRTLKRNRNIFIATAIAASLIFSFFLLRPISNVDSPQVIFKANAMADVITIQSGDGEVVELSAEASEVALDSVIKAFKIEHTEKISISTPRKRTCKFVLPDGSSVWLNAESHLEYNQQGMNRVANLRGEAFFKVAKDASRPFIVNTDRLHTRVLGTEFNVRSYASEDVHVTLIKGKVEVSEVQSKKAIVLSPGTDVQLLANNTFKATNVDIENYASWKDGYFYFDNISLEEIMKELGRWYNVSIQTNNHVACKQRLHFLANRNESLQSAIDLLNMMNIAKIEIRGDLVIIR